MMFTIYEGIPVSLRVTVSIFPRWNRICAEINGREPFDLLMERLVGKPRMDTRTDIEKTQQGGSFCVDWTERCAAELTLLVERELMAMGLPEEAVTVTHARKAPHLPPDKEKAEALFKRMLDYKSETE